MHASGHVGIRKLLVMSDNFTARLIKSHSESINFIVKHIDSPMALVKLIQEEQGKRILIFDEEYKEKV